MPRLSSLIVSAMPVASVLGSDRRRSCATENRTRRARGARAHVSMARLPHSRLQSDRLDQTLFYNRDGGC
eukprot:1017549-Pleurochrysis_carterae.AAC.2